MHAAAPIDASTTTTAKSAASPRPKLHLATVLGAHWKAYRAQRKECQRQFSEENVHDLRVATRRLLAVLDVIRAVEAQARVQKMRRVLKNQLDSLDDLRDVQVMEAAIGASLPGSPQLAAFHSHLQKRERRLLRAARKLVGNSRPAAHRKRIKKIRSHVRERSSGRAPATNLMRAADTAYGRVLQAYIDLDDQAASIHRLRIAFKKFRYVIEVLLPLLPSLPQDNLGRMHAYQSRMGDIQDMDVLIHALGDFVGRSHQGSAGADSGRDPKSSRDQYATHQAQLMTTYLEDKSELLSFWRAAPEQPFPWESQK
jgi:CHAD domain-containing protein